MLLPWLPNKTFRPIPADPLPWRRAGFHAITVLPPDAEPRRGMPAALRRLFMMARGKAPGDRNADGTWSLLHNWRGRRFHTVEMLEWPKWNPRPNLGLPMGECGLLDCDVAHPRLLPVNEMVHQLALDMLAPAPMRVGRAPKFGMLYRLEAPFKRQAVKFRHPDDKGINGLIEFLGEGYQAVVAGIHPATRQPYTWDHDPTRIRLANLPVIAQADVACLMKCLAAELERMGFVVGGSGRDIGDAGPPPDQEKLKAPNPHVLMETAEHLPNTQKLYPSRHDAITMGYRFKAAAQDFDQEGLFAWFVWLEKYDGPCGTDAVDFNTDFEAARDEWRRMDPPYRTGGYPTLRRMAMAAGWDGGLPYAGMVAEPPTLGIDQARARNAELTGLAFEAVAAWRQADAAHRAQLAADAEDD